jgi:hypothetical protein
MRAPLKAMRAPLKASDHSAATTKGRSIRYAITDHAMIQEGSAKLAAYREAGVGC